MQGPLEIETGYSGIILRHPAPPETLAKDKYDWTIIYSGWPRSDGPLLEPVYHDCVRVEGINVSATPGVKNDATKPYFARHIESKFYQPGIVGADGNPNPFMEYFLTFIAAGEGETYNHRPFGMVMTHDGSYIQAGYAVSQFTLQTKDHKSQVLFDFRENQKTITVEDAIKVHFATNNVPVAIQRNAANTASYKLPYLNGDDQIAIERPITTGNGQTAAGPIFQTRGSSTSAATFEAPDANAATFAFGCGRGSSKKSAFFGVDAAGNLVASQQGVSGSFFADFNTSFIWRCRAAGLKIAELFGNVMQFSVPVRTKVCTMATMPAPSVSLKWAEIVIEDHPDGPLKAMCDGTAWRRLAFLGAAI